MNDIHKHIDKNHIPKHVAVIMDGNGRWAKKNGFLRVIGHKKGVNSVRPVVEASVELGISVLTLYAFSTENWNRPKAEINALMELLVSSLNKEISTFKKNNIQLFSIGEIHTLPNNCQKKLNVLIEQREDLSESIDQLLIDLSTGIKKMRVYKQMKMYNDESLNPVLYKKDDSAKG